MNGAFAVGATALRADQKALEIIANNVANVNTPAFKRSEVRFAEVLANQVQPNGPIETLAAAATASSGGVRVSPQAMLLAQGDIRPTGRPMDLAIDGLGFIEIIGPSGQTLLWRGGTLQVSEDGWLATLDGMPLQAGLAVPADTKALSISANGLVSVETSSGESLEIGQIMLVRVEHAGALESLDNGLYRAFGDARLIDALPGEDGAGLFVQGAAEASNVELTEEMVRMLVVQRAYAANAQTIQAADQLAAITNNLKQ